MIRLVVIDMAPLKAKALNYPEPVKSIILSEPDKMECREFISKVGTWEKLLKMGVEK